MPPGAMYEKHFGLTERPFSIAPDPRFLYMSQRHREALAHLLYGVGEGGGFVQLTGEVGTGKTTVCRCLLEQLPANVDVALILNPRVTGLELIASLCDELGIEYPRDTTSTKALIDVLNVRLLEAHAAGRRTVMIIDEAQNLSTEALEQVRLLTNLETTREKLLQIILIGQPELRELLAREELRQLSQRITARCHLEPISRAETAAYIRHRLQVCGATDTVFTERAVNLIQRLSCGVPRLINVLCDRAMLGAFVEGSRRVDVRIVRRAAAEVLPEEADSRSGRRWWAAAAVLGGLALLIGWQYPLIRHWLPTAGEPAVSSTVMSSRAAGGERKTSAAGPPADSSAEPVPPQAPVAPEVATAMTSTRPEAGATQMPALERLLVDASPQAAARAWAGLFSRWRLQLAAASDEQACNQAAQAGLHCLQQGGSWKAVLRYDRPLLLLLTAPGGRRVPVLVESVQGDQAQIQIDGRRLQVGVQELLAYWFGEYRLLWRLPPGGRAALMPGDRGPGVVWLRERLRQATGTTAIGRDPELFDQGLKVLLQQFQRQQELTADGIAGARTIIRLNTVTRQPGIPRLLLTGQG